MSTLVLELAGPLQAWGDGSRFFRRETRMLPTKSGVIGLLAAAQGRRRTDDIEDLVSLRFGVRQDQTGTLIEDFQTAIDWEKGKSLPLSQRGYVADAKFVVGLQAEQTLLEGLAEAIASPAFPLFLGRRACAPTGRLVRGIRDMTLEETLDMEEWRASDWFKRKQPRQAMLLHSRDALPGEKKDETVRDSPKSFDPRHREFGWRDVVHGWTRMENPLGRAYSTHNEFELLGGV